MSSVSVIGLGAMGSAIARAFIAGGHTITVWNRSAERMRPFAADGIACAKGVDDCIAASPVAVICVDDYAASNGLLHAKSVESIVRDRTLVQFSTGTPREAREAERWALDKGARYLDGAILAYPREVGQDGLVFLCGKSKTYEDSVGILHALTRELRYLGEPIGAAAGIDVAILFYYVCTHLGLTQAALICESEGVSAELLASVIADSSASDVQEALHLGAAIANNDFSNPGATLGVYSGILDRVLSQAKDAGIDDEIPQFANRILKRGMQAGFGDEEIVSLIKLLRKETR